MRSLFLACVLCVGCACGADEHVREADADAAPDAAVDAAVDAFATMDAGSDAGGCETATSGSLADATWSTDFAPRGVSGDIHLVIAAAAHGDDLYFAGLFDHAGAVAARNVAVWSEAGGFRALGDGPPGSYVTALAIRADGTVLASVGSSLPGDGTLAQFREGAWTTLATADGPIASLAVDADDRVWIGGDFSTIGGTTTTGLVRWDGATFTPIPTPGPAGPILVDDHGVCIGWGGTSPHVSCQSVGETTWTDQALPTIPMTSLVALARDPTGALLAGGAVAVTPDHWVGVLRRDASGWSALGGGLESTTTQTTVRALTVAADGAVWALGTFHDTPALPPAAGGGIARWDGAAWSVPGDSRGGHGPLACAVRGSDVFVAGDFLGIGTASASGIARWDGMRWHGLTSASEPALGVGGASRIALGPTCETFVSGDFLAVGDVESAHVASLAGGAWSALPPFPATPEVLAVGPDGALYAGGFDPTWLTQPPVSQLLRLRNGAWEPVGRLVESVEHIAFADDGTLYVAAGTVLAYDGSDFAPLGTGGPTRTSALLAVPGLLLAAERDQVWTWDGSGWGIVGAGATFAIASMTLWEDHVYVAGAGLARIDGETFVPILFPDMTFTEITVADGRLFGVGTGVFPSPGRAAWWADIHAQWQSYGFDAAVTDVDVAGDAVWVAGAFTEVEGIPSIGIARLDLR